MALGSLPPLHVRERKLLTGRVEGLTAHEVVYGVFRRIEGTRVIYGVFLSLSTLGESLANIFHVRLENASPGEGKSLPPLGRFLNITKFDMNSCIALHISILKV